MSSNDNIYKIRVVGSKQSGLIVDFSKQSQLRKQKPMASAEDPDNENLVPIDIQVPPSYQGPMDDSGNSIYHTPEHLFLASLAGCYFTTFSVISDKNKLEYSEIVIDCIGTMTKIDGITSMAHIEESVSLILGISGDNSDEKAANRLQKKARKILEMVEKNCPLANSVKSAIIFSIEKIS